MSPSPPAGEPPELLPSQRHLFEIPDDVAYLNCAYMSPQLRVATAAGRDGVSRKVRPWDIRIDDFFALTESARRTFARLLGTPATADDVAIVPSASYGMATAALNLPLASGRRVIVLEGEFPSTILTWRDAARRAGAELLRLPRPADDDWTRVVLAAIDERTAVAALPAVHWLDGARLDLGTIRRRLTDVGGALALDLTQSLGAMPFALAQADPDFVVAACYKWLLGPYTTGFLYVAPRWHDGRPLEHNWFPRVGSDDVATLIEYPEALRPGARRFDMGECANFALLPAAERALEQLLAWGVPAIAASAGRLVDEIVARGAALGLTAVPAHLRAPHYVGLRRDGPMPAELPELLARERVFVSVRGGRTLRVTPHVYNSGEDVDRLFRVLEPTLAAASAASAA